MVNDRSLASRRLDQSGSSASPNVKNPYEAVTILLTERQRQALVSLAREDEKDIAAWLKLQASTNNEFQYRADQNGLSAATVEAIVALRGSAINQVLICLRRTRESGHTRLSSHYDSPAYSDSTVISGSCKPNTQVATVKLLTEVEKIYTCTICEQFRPFKNRDDWKRHEKEHLVTYICMRGELVKKIDGQLRCRLCEELDTSVDHFRNLHKIQWHDGQAQCPHPTKITRRSNMVMHLNNHHGVNNKSRGQALADEWKQNNGARYWSCGFCVDLFESFQDRLKHIGTKHFARRQSMNEWDVGNLIRGLLNQPEVNTAWEILTTSKEKDFFQNVGSISSIKDAQDLLERGPSAGHSAESLAALAYNALYVLNALRPTELYSPVNIDHGEVGSQYVSPANCSHAAAEAFPGHNTTLGLMPSNLTSEPVLVTSDIPTLSWSPGQSGAFNMHFEDGHFNDSISDEDLEIFDALRDEPS